ncbi:MAG: hypothetical protein NZ554_12945, partial [Bryobacteraceae bacterium]|nr:hypothetical protein [Bryobacteraceae bacterium]
EPPDIFVLGEQGFRRVMRLERTTPGAYRGRVRLGQARGMLRVRPLEESRAFPEAGLYLEEAEFAGYGNNPRLLEQLAAITGGRFEPTPAEVFRQRGRSVTVSRPLWPLLLAAALLLNLAEILLRKWPGVVEALTARPRAGRAAA